VGKSFLAQALGVEACHQQYSVLFVKTNAVLSDLAGGRADGTTRCACAATSARACSS
jgi:DNA replication protein DnaC